jgi:hypothetical protein
MSTQAKKRVAPAAMPEYAYDQSDKSRLCRLLATWIGTPPAHFVSFLCSQVPPDYKDQKGNTAVHILAEKNIGALPMLVKAWTRGKVDKLAHQSNDFKRNALHCAASAGNAKDFMQMLPGTFTAMGAPTQWPPSGVNALGGKYTALSIASERGCDTDVRALLKCKADPAQSVGEKLKDALCRNPRCRNSECTFAHSARELGTPRDPSLKEGSRTALHLALLKYDESENFRQMLVLLANALGPERTRKQLEYTLREFPHLEQYDLAQILSQRAALLPGSRAAPRAPWAEVATPEKAISDVASTSGSIIGLTSPSSACLSWDPPEHFELSGNALLPTLEEQFPPADPPCPSYAPPPPPPTVPPPVVADLPPHPAAARGEAWSGHGDVQNPPPPPSPPNSAQHASV